MAETISGQVERVSIKREGWGTLDVLYGSARETATVTGHPLGVKKGDTVEVVGAWTKHPKYGPQFKADKIRVVAPSDAIGAIEWICSRLPRVGRKRATEMIARWPLPEIWAVLASRPGELVVIDGITPQTAARIGAAYRKVEGERERIVALRGWGLSDRQAARVVEKWGADALERLRANPYLLAEQIDGFGFLRSDAVAMRMGLALDHPMRVRAALGHLLKEAKSAGHTFVPAGKLIAMTAKLLAGAVTEQAVLREGRAVIQAGKMVQREARGGEATHIYAPALDAAEQAVADAVKRLGRSKRDGRGRPALERAGGEAA